MSSFLPNEESAVSTSKPLPTQQQAEEAVKVLLRWIGENPDREGLKDTPTRVVRAYKQLFQGYSDICDEHLHTFFNEVSGYNNSILIRNISFFSHCEHHMVPIIGQAHIAYFPKKRVIGLSKIPRIVERFARRLQTQEALTAQIASNLEQLLQPKGVAVLIEAEHMCMTMRGVQKAGALTVTRMFTGAYSQDKELQKGFLSSIKN